MEYLQMLCCSCPMGTSAVRGDYAVLQANNTKWSNMSCEMCNMKFNLLRRKRTCRDCGHSFCLSCIRKMKGIEKPIQCHRCLIFRSVPLSRDGVMGLRVRDLRWFLETNHVPTHGCKEKQELVDLVMHHAALRNASSAYPQNYERHTVMPEVEVPHLEAAQPLPPVTQESMRTGLFSRQNVPVQADASGQNVSTEVEVHESEEDGFTVFTLNDRDSGDNEDDVQATEGEAGAAEGECGGDDETPAAEGSVPMDIDETSHLSQSEEVRQQDSQEEEEEGEHERNEQSREQVKGNERSYVPLTIDNIKSKEQILELSVMELKLLLTRNFVSFKGMCEKGDLQQKVIQLWEQRQISKDLGNVSDENLCKICFESAIDSVLLDCGHVVTCTECGKQLHECPICRQYVVRVVHIFKA